MPHVGHPTTGEARPARAPARGAGRRSGAAGLAAAMALGTIPALTAVGTAAHGAVSVGENISAFPDRDMVVAVGYQPGETLRIEALRNDVVIGWTQGPAVSTPEGVGIEVNHGPEGAVQPGDCWIDYTPNIMGGDVIRVTAVDRVGAPSDTMTVKDLAFARGPYQELNGDVSIEGTATPGLSFAVEFRRDKPAPRFRRGPFAPVFEPGTNKWKATFRVPTSDSPEGLTPQQQRDIALTEANWLAVSDQISETTLAEHGEPGGVGPGCTGSDDPNTLVGGTDPINAASVAATAPARIFSGTARAGVTAVSVTVGSLGARDATLTVDPNGGPSTWTLSIPSSELATLADGTVAVTPRFDTLTGATKNVLKDTAAPAAPTATPAPGSYSTTQHVALVKPTGESTGKLHWEIGGSATSTRNPDATSQTYTTQIAVSSSQTIKARVIDAAGNPGTMGTFTYQIGAAPTNPPPTVAPLSPAAGATGVSTTNNITMRMSEAVTNVSGTTVTLHDTATGGAVASGVTYKPDTLGVILNPNATLAPGTRYTVTVNPAGVTTPIRDAGGAALVTRTWEFTTAGTATTDPAPTVTTRSPASGATGVARSATVTATFSEAVQGVSGSTFTLRNASGAAVTAAVSYNSTTRVATLDPGADLTAGATYTATLTGGTSAIRDLTNRALTTTTWSFTVASGTTTNAPPTLTARSPGSGATGVSKVNNITMRFSEAVQGVSASTVTLRVASSGALVSRTVTYKSDTFGVVLDPGVTLAANTRYTVTVTGGTTAVRDLAGAPFATTSWSFTTGG